MPTLNWVGKDKVVNHHQEVPFKTLRHLYRFDAPAGTPAATASFTVTTWKR
jgi:adenine-specific DNA-methyltransferase